MFGKRLFSILSFISFFQPTFLGMGGVAYGVGSGDLEGGIGQMLIESGCWGSNADVLGPVGNTSTPNWEVGSWQQLRCSISEIGPNGAATAKSIGSIVGGIRINSENPDGSYDVTLDVDLEVKPEKVEYQVLSDQLAGLTGVGSPWGYQNALGSLSAQSATKNNKKVTSIGFNENIVTFNLADQQVIQGNFECEYQSGAPQPPIALSAEPLSKTSVKLSWTPSEKGAPAVVAWAVGSVAPDCKGGKAPDVVAWTNEMICNNTSSPKVPAAWASTMTVSGLKPGTEYSFSVCEKAMSLPGLSAPVTAQATTPSATPAPSAKK